MSASTNFITTVDLNLPTRQRPLWGSMLHALNGSIAALWIGALWGLFQVAYLAEAREFIATSWLMFGGSHLDIEGLAPMAQTGFWLALIGGGTMAAAVAVKTLSEFNLWRNALWTLQNGPLLAKHLREEPFRVWLLAQQIGYDAPLLNTQQSLELLALLHQYMPHGDAPHWLRVQVYAVLPRFEQLASIIEAGADPPQR